MPFFNRLAVAVLSAALMVPAVSPGAPRPAHKANVDFAQGRVLEEKKDWDGALAAYQKALAQEPSNLEYQMAVQKARFEGSQMHVENGLKVRSQGMLGEAMLEFQRAFAINPGSAVAVQEVRATQDMIQRERDRVTQTGKESTPEERALTPIELLKKQTDDRLDRMLPVPELKPLGPDRFDLQINSTSPKTLYETLGAYTGINVLWDSDTTTNNTPASIKNGNVHFQNSTISEAFDYLALLTKTFWKPLSANTIFVTADNRNNRTAFADQVLKIFYLSNLQGQQDLQEVVTAARTMTDVQRMNAVNSQNAIIARADADSMALVEKIIHDLDRPRSEVVVDIIVMQTSTDHSRQLAAALMNGGLNMTGAFTPANGLQVTTPSTTGTTGTTTPATTTTGTSVPLSNLGHLASADWSTTLPGALLQAVMADTDTKVLQAPQVRSVDMSKATLKVGSRIPTATGSYQPGVGAVGVNPLVNTQFSYTDVGVNIVLQPRVHDNGDVSMNLDMDISSQSGNVTIGGITEPIFSQNHLIYDLRMREGEIGLVGGLVNIQDTKTVNGIPGLGNIPLLRRLFTSESMDHQRSELMIALVPHVLRRPEFSAENLRVIGVGTGNAIHVNYAPKTGDDAPPPSPVGQSRLDSPAPSAPPPPPAAVSPAAPSAPGPSAPGPPLPGGVPFPLQQLIRPAGGVPPATATPAQPVPPATARFAPPALTTSVNAAFTVALVLDGGADVASASPLQIQYDPKVLRLTDVSPGDLFSKDGTAPVFARDIQNDQGLVNIQLARPGGVAGVAGPGTLVTLNFLAVGPGSTTVSALNVTVRNSKAMAVGSSNPQLSVNVAAANSNK